MSKLIVVWKKNFNISKINDKDIKDKILIDISASVFIIGINKPLELSILFKKNIEENKLKETLIKILNDIKNTNYSIWGELIDTVEFELNNYKIVDDNDAMSFAIEKLKELLNELALEIEQKIKEF